MGVDAMIYCRTLSGEPPCSEWGLPVACEARACSGESWEPEGATHQISNPWRYYGEGYERGPWFAIGGLLMHLLSDDDVTTVWYNGDGDEGARHCDVERVIEISRHYMTNGRRPYYH